jgi:5-carboxymethyl-2-hydroxymuconate isomerase
MPHCVLEYSSNVVDPPDLSVLLEEIHRCLMETGHFQLPDIKSRAIRHEVFRVGDGSAETSFVSLTIAILEGRTDEAKARLAVMALEVLKRAYSKALSSQKLSLSVEIREMHRGSYHRYRSGPA